MKNQSFEFLPAIKPVMHCNCCSSGTESHLSLDTILYNGFGGWSVTKDGELFYLDDNNTEFEDSKSLRFIEEQAAADPDHDWRAIGFFPLHGETYQRQNGKWVLVERNEGFA